MVDRPDTADTPQALLAGRIRRMRLLLAAAYLALPLITPATLALTFSTYENNRVPDLSHAVPDLVTGCLSFLITGWWPFLVVQWVFARSMRRNSVPGSRVLVPVVVSTLCLAIPDALYLGAMAFDIMEADLQRPEVAAVYGAIFGVAGPVVGLVLAVVGWFLARIVLRWRS
jgi:hypothetical protein